MKARTETVVLPAFLASALINGDTTGLEESELHWVTAAEEYVAPGRFIDVGESYFAWHNELPGFNLGSDVAEYTVLYDGDDELTPPEPMVVTESVVDVYLTAAAFFSPAEVHDAFDPAWSTPGHDQRGPSEVVVRAFTKTARKQARAELERFAEGANLLFRVAGDKALEENRQFTRADDEQVARSFWLRRVGSGSGFKEYPEHFDNNQDLASALDRLAASFGVCDVVLNRGRLSFWWSKPNHSL